MSIHLSIKCIFLAIGALIAQEVDFCVDQYCYRSDGKLINITSLKDAQDYCFNYDSTSWLLEIYDMNTLSMLYRKFYGKNLLWNTIGTVASEWTSITNGQLPSGLNIDVSLGHDFLYLNVSGGQLYFQGSDKTIFGSYICRVTGNCDNGYCYNVVSAISTWSLSVRNCYASGGHLATFDGMTYEQISNLSFVKQLTENTIYWIGYSKLVYKWQHSNVWCYILSFTNPYPLLTTSHPNESYFVYEDTNKGYTYEKPVGNEQFEIICMRDNTTTTGQTSNSANPTSAANFVSFNSSTAEIYSNSFETKPTTASLTSSTESTAFKATVTSSEPTNATATTRGTSTPANPISESTAILSLVLPILMWLVFAISFTCCILPLCVKKITRKETKEAIIL